MRWSRIVDVVLGAASVAVTVSLYTRFFRTDEFLPPLLLAVVIGALAGAAMASRYRGWIGVGVAVLAVPILGVLSGRRHDLLAGSARDLQHGVGRMLTITLPAESAAALLIVPVTVSAVAAFAAAALGVTTRAALLPALPGLLALVIALLLTATSEAPRYPAAAAFAVVALALAFVRANRAAPGSAVVRHPGTATRSALVGGVVVLSACAFGLGTQWAIPLANSSHRVDPRSKVQPPLSVSDQVSPLGYLQGQLLGQRRTLFTVSFPGSADPPVDRIRLAAMDGFDGSLWTVTGQFRQAGTHLEPPRLLGGRDYTMDVHIEASIPFGPYVPAFGAPIAVTSIGYAAQADQGVLLATAAPTAGRSFEFTAALGRPTDDQLRGALAAPGSADLRLGVAPPAVLVQLAQSLTSGATSAYARVIAIQRYVRSLPYNAHSAPGHSYYSLRRLVDADRPPGFAEQQASLFAVLARIVGVPTRVACGYILDRATEREGTFRVTTNDASAWPEVHLDGLGWVPFDATDPTRTVTAPPKKILSVGPPSRGRQRAGTGPPRVDKTLRVSQNASRPWATLFVGSLAGLVVLGGGGIIGAKRVIRRRRRGGGTADQIVGAWRSIGDSLRESGVATSRAQTPGEVAEIVSHRLGATIAEPIVTLAPLVARSLYSPGGPEPGDGPRAWALADQVAVRTRERVPWWRIPLLVLDPRPLLLGPWRWPLRRTAAT